MDANGASGESGGQQERPSAGERRVSALIDVIAIMEGFLTAVALIADITGRATPAAIVAAGIALSLTEAALKACQHRQR